jgi:hypothetical protein
MSKVDLMPMPPAGVRDALYSVIAGALAGGAPEPSWVAVDDGGNSWIVEVSTRPVSERVHGVVAAASENAIVTAQRLGVGGALWLPPSSLGALDAFSAAAATEAAITIDAASIELHDGARSNHVVTIVDTLFWKVQLGDRMLEALLSELAVALAAPAAILGWPALVVADRQPDVILSTWEELASEGGRLRPSLEVTSMPQKSLENGLFEGAYPKLVGRSTSEGTGGQIPPQPVHELPQGRRIGWWRMGEGEETDGQGWIATPTVENVTRCRWQIEGGERPGVVAEVLAADEVEKAGDIVAVRIPGWASRGLQTGSPAGLLAARIADAATRRGLPLWIPGVDEEALRFVLGLPGTIWVDGPAVPG